MSRLFSPKMPSVPEPPVPPTYDEQRQAEDDLMAVRRRRGRASTFLTGGLGRRTMASDMLLGGSSGAPGTGMKSTPKTPTRANSL